MKQQAQQLAQNARRSSPAIGNASTQTKNALLADFAGHLNDSAGDIQAANQQDLDAAAALAPALRERLVFGEKEIAAATAGIAQVIAQRDPIGAIDNMRVLPSGIQVGQMRMPLGVLLMIYESRPNVTIDAAALALKAGNAVILRGGSEARHTNAAIAKCLQRALAAHGLDMAAQVVADTAHELLHALLLCKDDIDLVIPRGGRQLMETVQQKAQMPALYHPHGNCHVYVDSEADMDMAANIVENAKTRRYGVCNAAESLLVHRDIAADFLPRAAARLAAHKVEMRACQESRPLLEAAGASGVTDAAEEDYSCEYLAPVISVKIVASLDGAIAHINRYGSAHTDAIVSGSIANCTRFARLVESSSVMVNASTAFADGGEYGLGAEIGIATGKLHARGPIGMDGLTTQKYVVLGSGHCRS